VPVTGTSSAWGPSADRIAALSAGSLSGVLEACALKADHPMALGDAFAVATAQAYRAVLLTGDPEILDGVRGWELEDLR